MPQIVVDAVTSNQLRDARQTSEILDSTGRVLGKFIPSQISADLEPRIAEEEVQRRENAGGGRSLASILADLEKQP